MSDLVGNPEDRFSRVAAQLRKHANEIYRDFLSCKNFPMKSFVIFLNFAQNIDFW